MLASCCANTLPAMYRFQCHYYPKGIVFTVITATNVLSLSLVPSQLSEVVADLAEEHSTAQLAGERLEAEQADRMRLEKELDGTQVCSVCDECIVCVINMCSVCRAVYIVYTRRCVAQHAYTGDVCDAHYLYMKV